MISIVFRNGEVCHYYKDEYTDYKYDGKYFIVIKDKQWIGFYNLDCVECIEVELPQTDCDHRCVQTEIGCERIDCTWK